MGELGTNQRRCDTLHCPLLVLGCRHVAVKSARDCAATTVLRFEPFGMTGATTTSDAGASAHSPAKGTRFCSQGGVMRDAMPKLTADGCVLVNTLCGMPQRNVILCPPTHPCHCVLLSPSPVLHAVVASPIALETAEPEAAPAPKPTGRKAASSPAPAPRRGAASPAPARRTVTQAPSSNEDSSSSDSDSGSDSGSDSDSSSSDDGQCFSTTPVGTTRSQLCRQVVVTFLSLHWDVTRCVVH